MTGILGDGHHEGRVEHRGAEYQAHGDEAGDEADRRQQVGRDIEVRQRRLAGQGDRTADRQRQQRCHDGQHQGREQQVRQQQGPPQSPGRVERVEQGRQPGVTHRATSAGPVSDPDGAGQA
jgi:hypothetical protein